MVRTQTIRGSMTVNDRGVFLTQSKRLSARQVRTLRNRCERETATHRQEIENKRADIAHLEQRLKALAVFHEQANSPAVEAYLKQADEEARQVKERAEKFLRDTIGDDLYAQLKRRSYIEFDSSGRHFKMYRSGKTWEKDGTTWKWFCVIRPSDLPLPDYTAAVFANVQNRAEQLHRR